METIANTKILLDRKLLTYTAKVRNFLTRMCEVITYDILAAQICRKRQGFFDWFYWTYLIFKMKRNLRSAKKQNEELVLKRFSMKSRIFKEQYLQRDLKSALAIEDYNECARLRDLINIKKPEK